MPFIAWLTLGLLIGVIATQTHEPRAHWSVSLALGVIGAVVGGFVVRVATGAGASGLDVFSLFAAIVGAIAAVAIHYGVRRDRRVY